MKIVLIEDEILVAQGLRKMISGILPGVEVPIIIDTVETGIEYFRKNEAPDLIISDIQLGDGLSFDIFKSSGVNSPVIFVTAFDEYAIRAFKLNSIDYLLKPVGEVDLRNALEKFRKNEPAIQKETLLTQFEHLLADLKPGAHSFKTRFTAHRGSAIIPVALENVAAFVKDEIIFLLTRQGEKLITDYNTLDELEEILDPKVFYRANRQYLMHIDAIASYRQQYSGKLCIYLSSYPELELIVSREKATSFKRWFEEAS